MDASHFDAVSKFFAQRSLSRRDAMIAGGTALAATGLAAGGLARTANAQEATPAVEGDATAEPDWDPAQKVDFLFVQTFQAGTITSIAGVDGRYALTLEPGTGQTVYFSDRPDRIVGATPTVEFLEGLGFPPDNPPNAALVVETAPGETDIAVVELFNPLYDPITQGVTYEVEVLQNWQASLELGLSEAPTDLAALAPSFGAAHLFIDDCNDEEVYCWSTEWGMRGTFGEQPMCWNYGVCMPCEPHGHVQPDRCSTYTYWDNKCRTTFATECRYANCFAEWAWWGSDWVCFDRPLSS